MRGGETTRIELHACLEAFRLLVSVVVEVADVGLCSGGGSGEGGLREVAGRDPRPVQGLGHVASVRGHVQHVHRV